MPTTLTGHGEGLRGAGFGIAGGGDLGDPEIQDLHQAALGHHDVARLEVAMHDARGVGGGERIGNLDRDRQHLAQRRPVRDDAAPSVLPSTHSMAMKSTSASCPTS